MKLIAIETGKRQNGDFVFTALREASEHERATLEDVALAYRHGRGVHVDHTKGGLARRFGEGIDDGQVEQILKTRDVESFVFVLGSADQVDAVARRVRTIADDDFPTYDVEGTELRETTARDSTYALEDTEGALLEEQGLPQTIGLDDTNLTERANRG